MASFAEIRAKMNKNYGDTEEEKKKQQEQRRQTSTASATSNFTTVRNEMESKYNPTSHVDDSFVSQFFKDAQSYLDTAQKSYENMGYGNMDMSYADRHKKTNDLRARSWDVRQYLEKNKGNMKKEDYTNFMSILDSFDKSAMSTDYSFYKKKEGMSKYDSEEAYNTAVKQWQDYYDKWGHYADAEDFGQYSSAGKEIPYTDIGSETRHRAKSRRQRSYTSIDNYRAAAIALAEHNGNNVAFKPQYEDKIAVFRNMKSDEFQLLSYFIAKDKAEGSNLAEQYVDAMADTLTSRRGQEIATNLDNIDIPVIEDVAKLATGWAGGFINAYEGIVQYATGEKLPTDVSQYANKYISESLDGIGYYAHQAATTIGNMTPSILVSSALGPAAGAATMGVSVAGNAYAQALDWGYDKTQARVYGTIIGALEGGLQYAIGGISKLSGLKLDGKIVSKIAAIDNAALRISAKLGWENLKEIGEEELQNYLEPLVRTIVLGEEYDAPTAAELFETAIVTLFSTSALEGPGTIYGDISDSKHYKNEYGEFQADLVDQALEGGDFANQLAQKYKGILDSGKDLSGHQLGRLVEANEQQFRSEDMANIQSAAESRLTELGEAGDVSAIAKALTKQAAGEKLSRAEQQIISNSKYGQRVANEMNRKNILSGGYASTWAENIGTERINVEEYSRLVEAAQLPQETAEATEGKLFTKAQKFAQPAQTSLVDTPAANTSPYEVSAEGKTIDKDGNVIDIVGVDSVKDGRMILKTNTGTIDSSDVQYANETDALVYSAVSKLGASPSSSWNMINGFKESDGVSARTYAAEIPLAYRYGKLNYKKGLLNLNIAPKQSAIAFEMGREDAAAAVKPATNASTESTLSEKNADKKVIFEGFTYNEKSANDVQKASMAAIDMINKASSLEIHVYKSVRKNGKLYAVVNGKERLAPNGYFTDGNKIYIDINAGNKGEGLMLYTLSHEIGHYIARYNAKDFKAISDFLFEHYGKDVPIDVLIEEQKAKLKKSYEADGKTIPSESVLEKAAQEELVCDMLSQMMADKHAYDKLMDLKQKDLNAFQKLGQAIKKALDKLAKVLGIYDTQNPDFMYAASKENIGEEAFLQLQDLYVRAFVQADANYQAEAAQKNTTEDGGVMYSMKYDDAIDQLHAGTLDRTMNTHLKVLDNTPQVYIDKAGAKNLKIIMGWDIAYLAMNKSGDLLGNYHGLGPEVMKAIPQALKDPLYIVKQDNGRIIAVTEVVVKGNRSTLVSIELDAFKSTTQDGESESENYNLIVTIFDAKANYLQKLMNNGKIVHNKNNEDPAHFILRLKSLNKALPDDDRAKSSNKDIAHDAEDVKNESTEALDIELDANTESVSPAILKSERTWTESDYVQERETAAKGIANAIGVSVKKAKAYIDSVNSIAKMIAEDRVRLDYFSSPGRSSFVGNVEYGGSFDFSTLCKKRRLLTGTFTAIQKALPNTALTADEILDIRNRMKDAGLEVSCGLCYVEGSRANMGQFAKEFLRLYKQYYPDAWQPNMADVNTPDGIEWVRINHPECYEQYEYFWNHYGTLKDGDKNLFASQQKPKLYQLHTEYKGEILEKFNDDDNVEEKNLNGGIRLQSFSDFEIVHLIDTMQIIMDMSRVGLAGQAYTKVPDFAWALGDTGLKINLSLIAKGVDANGRLIFDDVEGMPIDKAVELRNRYSKNVGTILVAFNDEQLLAAMADERVDYIIPFHRSQWKKSQYGAMGLPTKTKDYTYMQNEKFIKPQYHEYRGRMVKDKATNYMPNEYWDFSKSGKENAEAYLEMCARNNKRPKFYKLLQNNGDGSYSLKADGSTDGYWKLLIDFKMYDNDGVGSPQMPVKPDFNMDEATRMLDEYSGGHSNFPVAQSVVDSFVEEYKDSHKGVQYSDRDNAPTFYSQMARVVDGVKQEKLGAASVVSMLRGKGVKAEEIKWSGIEAWLEGKKSVTKAELQEFIAGSMLQIEEEILDNKDRPYTEDQQKKLDEYEAKQSEIAKRLADEWKKITGEDFPVRNPGAGLESTVVNKIIDANKAHKDASFEGRLLKKLRKDLEEVIKNNDDFGFDSWKDALRSIHRHRRDFIKYYEMSTNDKAIIVKYCNALNAYNELPNRISDEDTDRLRAIARETDPWDRKIMEVKHEYNEEAAKYRPNWKEYSLKGGKNYREMLFRIPGSTYSNAAMFGHWKDRSGVLAHARVQDMDTFIGKMLFIEEIQSDWHNEGHKEGYRKEGEKTDLMLSRESKKAYEEFYTAVEKMLESNANWEDDNAIYYAHPVVVAEMFDGNESYFDEYGFTEEQRETIRSMVAEEAARQEALKTAPKHDMAPDAPFKDTYHEYVLKRLLRLAAEEGYDSIGWTPAAAQMDRWNPNRKTNAELGLTDAKNPDAVAFEEAYRNVYDRRMRKFLSDFGSKWGTTVGNTVLDNGTEVWSMAITDSMKDSVMTEGQPLYQDRTEDSVSNRSLLANAFEGVAQNEIEKNKIQEYKEKISLINSEEQKLSELNEQIKELSFAKGPRDTKAIRDLQFEARQTANRINTYDKQLLRLEASKPLQDVLQREKKMAYKRAEQKGKEALEAYREKTMKTQRELLEKWQDSRKKGIEGRHKTAMRHKIKDIVNELNQYLLRGTKDRHVPIELQKAVAEALDAVNMDTVGAEERIAKLKDELLKAKTPEQIQEISRKIDHIQAMGDKMNGRLQKLKDAYDQFVNSDDPLIANSHGEVISNKLQSVIDSIGNTPLRDMTLSQLEDVYDMYRMVLTTIRNANKAFKAKKSESISTIANRVMEEVEKVGGKQKQSLAMLNGIKSFGWNNLKPVYAFEHIGSDHFTEVFKNVRAGEDVWAMDVTEAREFYLDKSKKYKYDSWDLKKRHKFTSTSGMDFELDLEQIMSLYAYSKRDQAADHLNKGGIVFDESTKIIKKTKVGISLEFNPTEATAYNISPETLADIVSKLTDEQKGFVDEMQDYLSTVMGAKGNEVSLEMYGVKLFKEKFYFPLKSAQQFMAKAKEQQKGEVKIKNSGFSKETVQKASNPIVLTPFMNVWADHVNEMSMYHAFVLPLEDFYRVYNYKTPTSDTMATESVEMFIQNAYGKGATKYIDQLLKDLNGGARTDSTTGFINKMSGRLKKGAVFASLSVVVQQPSALARAAALVDTKYFIGPKVDHKRHKTLWNEVKQYAPVAIIKEMGYFDVNMGKSTQDFILGKEYEGFKEKMSALVTDSNYRDEALSKAPALADEIAWCSIWEAVKRETQAKNPGVDVKSEEFLKTVGERFTDVIVKTQVYDSVLSRSGLMRSKDTGMKMATAFMAEPTTSINMVADALLQGKRGNRKYARTAIGAVIASQILNSILVSFVYAGRDDDEDETYLEKYIGTLSGEVLDSLNPAEYIPFIKDIVSIVKGYDVERSDMAVVSDLWNAWKNLSKDNVSVYRKVEGFAGSIAQIFGLPVKNIMRDARGIYQTVMSFVNGQQTTAAGIGYAVNGAITGKTVSDSQQLYEAYLSGDEEHLARVTKRYEDEKAVSSAMSSAIKNHYMEGDIDADTAMQYLEDYCGLDADAAYWKVDAWEYDSETGSSDDYSKYGDFYTAVESGKNLRAVIKEYTDNGVTTGTLMSQITSHFKPQYIEMTKSERASIKGYLRNGMVYCGMNEVDATERLRHWDFLAEFPDYSDLSESAVTKYYESVKSSGISVSVYYKYCQNKADYSKKDDIMNVINNLPITSAQKDALYTAEGWAKSKLYEAPWH